MTPHPIPRRLTHSLCRVTTTIAFELLAAKVWWRGKATIGQLVFGGTSEIPTLRPSPITRLPQELVELTISYFIRDTRTLLACSMICYSWYIAAVPHLHHTLTIDTTGSSGGVWPKPLRNAYNLDLLPLVKQFRFRALCTPFTPAKLNMFTLRHFSAPTNLQELGVDDLQLPSFMPNIQRYFGHFAPTLRFLALREPRGSSRQILYFIGLFPNLQDLKLCYNQTYMSQISQRDGMVDADLIPLSIPPLCGRLTLMCFAKEKLVKDMVTFFAGLHFRYMDLFRVKCVRLVLGACANTLEGLRLYPTDPYREEFSKGVDSSERTQAHDLQRTTKPCARISISHATLPFGRWRLPRYRSRMQERQLLVSSKPYYPPSHPLCPSTSSSATVYARSVVTRPVTSILVVYPQATEPPKTSFI